jgi:hypothetical protein
MAVARILKRAGERGILAVGCLLVIPGWFRPVPDCVLTGNKHRMEGSNLRPRAGWLPG